MRARRVARSLVTSPIALAGEMMATRTTGSSTIGDASLIAAMKALRPAETNATSFESTG